MRSALLMLVGSTVVACRDASPPLPLPPAAALDPGWDGAPRLPQLEEIEATYARIGEQRVPAVTAGLLVCHVDVEIDPNDSSPPDLLVYLRIGTRHEVAVRAPYSNAWSATVSFPGTDLVMGEPLRVALYDEDMWSNNDYIGSFTTTFDGTLPIVFRGGTETVECRALEPAVLHAQLGTALAEADRALAVLAAIAPPDFVAHHLALPDGGVAAARTGITRAAALVGWHAPLVRSRVEQLAAVERAWAARVEAAADQLVATLPAPGAPGASATMTCDAVAIDRALPVDARPSRPASACLVTVEGHESGDRLELYTPRSTLVQATCCREPGLHLFPVSELDVPAIRLARLTRPGEPVRILRVR